MFLNLVWDKEKIWWQDSMEIEFNNAGQAVAVLAASLLIIMRILYIQSAMPYANAFAASMACICFFASWKLWRSSLKIAQRNRMSENKKPPRSTGCAQKIRKGVNTGTSGVFIYIKR